MQKEPYRRRSNEVVNAAQKPCRNEMTQNADARADSFAVIRADRFAEKNCADAETVAEMNRRKMAQMQKSLQKCIAENCADAVAFAETIAETELYGSK